MNSSGKRNLVSVEHSPAAESIAGNEDLVREILLRLPVKSLLRFESVSKKWLSLISDPHFAQSYTHHHNPNYEPSGLLLNNRFFRWQFIPLDDDDQSRVNLLSQGSVKFLCPDDPGFRILQSCNGLLLCSPSHCKKRDPFFDCYIYNPTTKKYRFHRFLNREFGATLVAVNMVFDPSKSSHYKLICIREMDEPRSEPNFTYRIDIYSSETDYLKPSSNSGSPLTITAHRYGIYFDWPIYCNGAIHWYGDEGDTSLYFDIDTECLKTMPMPPSRLRGWYFGESRGHLHLMVYNLREYCPTKFDIMELKADYSGWFVAYRVDLDAVAITYPEMRCRKYGTFSVLCVVRAEKEEDSTLVICVPGKAISFNLHDKTWKVLCDLVPNQNAPATIYDYGWFDADQYILALCHV
ncbi:hypothetical protein L1049_014791 [Liquidambar formosana]|uniref:F-box domain-containing protein n=1 Tax=Liquidambar formosana TaxID=63359 RepID=A0AAP0RWH4_LIQFO